MQIDEGYLHCFSERISKKKILFVEWEREWKSERKCNKYKYYVLFFQSERNLIEQHESYQSVKLSHNINILEEREKWARERKYFLNHNLPCVFQRPTIIMLKMIVVWQHEGWREWRESFSYAINTFSILVSLGILERFVV